MWRHRPTSVVCDCKAHCGPDWQQVVVVSMIEWRRLIKVAVRGVEATGDLDDFNELSEIITIVNNGHGLSKTGEFK